MGAFYKVLSLLAFGRQLHHARELVCTLGEMRGIDGSMWLRNAGMATKLRFH